MRIYDHKAMVELLARALSGGAKKISPSEYLWDISSNCENPYCRTMVSRPEGKSVPKAYIEGGKLILPTRQVQMKYVHIDSKSKTSIFLDLLTRCRKCDACLRHRSFLWRCRSQTELLDAPRSWFGTLTLRADLQFAYTALARAYEGNKSYGTMSINDKFRAVCKQIAPEITRYIKRVRKNSDVPLRYLIVSEAHKSGLPHFHILFHQCMASDALTYRHISDAWALGFSNFKLVDGPKAGAYVCKYLSKSLLSRVRASQGYGNFNYSHYISPEGLKYLAKEKSSKIFTFEEMWDIQETEAVRDRENEQ